jgi:hypothetical protein
LLSLFGSLAGLAGVYTASYFLVKKYYPTYINVFPINPADPLNRKQTKSASTESIAPPPSVVPARTASPKKRDPRRTIVERDSDAMPAGRLVLQGVSGPVQGRSIPVENSYFRIGADPESDLTLADDDYVSGRHAAIQASDGAFLLVDQGSRNGTYVDGERLEAGPGRVLRSGQSIRIGASEFRVMLADERSAARASATTGTVR